MSKGQYEFKKGAIIPVGVSADGIMAERELIVRRFGAATLTNSRLAVQTDPASFPNILAFCPATTERAIEMAIESCIRKAYGSIVTVRVTQATAKSEPRRIEVRALHSVKKGPNRVFETLVNIAQDPELKNQLLKQLEHDAAAVYDKQMQIIAELKELSSE